MSKKIEQIEIQKLIQEYNFLLLDEEYKNELINENRDEFLNKVREFIGVDEPTKLEENNIENKKPPIVDPDKIDNNLKNKVKKIYRDIVKITHPDKTNSIENNRLYIEATKAYDEYDLFTLYNICAKLNIYYEMDKNDKTVLMLLIKDKKENIKKIESSFIWVYISGETDEIKEELVTRFANKHKNNL